MSEHFYFLASTPPKHFSSSRPLNVLPGDLMSFQAIKLSTPALNINNYQLAALLLKLEKQEKELELHQPVHEPEFLLDNLC